MVYYITYKNVLKPNKKLDDFKMWLKNNWPTQKKWGAIAVKVWPQKGLNNRVVFCRYTIKNLDRWNKKNRGKHAEPLINTLNDLIEMDRLSLKISPFPIRGKQPPN